MKKTKRALASVMALALAFGMTACGSTSSSGDSKAENTGKDLNDDQKEQISTLEDKLEDFELENKQIEWFSFYDINPYDGAVKDPAIELFEKKYGGTIKWGQTTWDGRFTDLATRVMSNNSPDFYPTSDSDTFPVGAIKGMFQSIDGLEHLDLDSELWADTVDIMNYFKFNGERYLCAVYIAPGYVCAYNRTTMEDNGYEDPAELYYNDEWTWDKFYDMCVDFTDQDNDKCGLDGYGYTNAISETCGVPIIGYEDGKLINNMRDPKIEKVQNMMYELGKNNVMFDRSTNNWYTRGDGTTGFGLGTYQTLFIPVGLWALEVPLESTAPFGDMEEGEVMFCPMPRDPDGDTYYVTSRVEGYVLCRNAPNPDGFAAFMNCAKVCQESTQNIKEDTLINEYKWNQDMIDMRNEILELCKTNPVFEIQEGISSEFSGVMNNVTQATMVTGGNSETWTQCIEEYSSVLDFLISETNEKMKNVMDTGEFEEDL